MKKYLISLAAVVFASILPLSAAPLKIAAALPDLGSIAAYVGGDKVEVFAIGRNNANPHAVEVLPSYMIRVSRAAIYLKVGLALDQWSNAIIDGSRNNKLTVVDCSNGIQTLQKPAGKVDASMGDVHPEGNPHYWLDPANGVIIAGNVLAALTKADPANGAYYQKNYERFKDETEKRLPGWKDAMAAVPGKKVISYHSSWVYFAAAFGLAVAGNVEPLPGIPPTAKHLAELVDLIKQDGLAVLLQEMYFPDAAPQFLARQTGIKVYKFSPSCENVNPDSYFRHFDEITARIKGGK
ncbi:MAG: zinc ABC transporter substrate-binding protein [Elusimicrobia bacterium]|nr:zinc ABC transporter substrate-binding protein [Elusimicrobiota bacterium]